LQYADDPLGALNLASVSFGLPDVDKLGIDDGSGELTRDVMPPAERITGSVVDDGGSDSLRPPTAESDAMSKPHRTQMTPRVSVVLSKQSSPLRMLCLSCITTPCCTTDYMQ